MREVLKGEPRGVADRGGDVVRQRRRNVEACKFLERGFFNGQLRIDHGRDEQIEHRGRTVNVVGKCFHLPCLLGVAEGGDLQVEVVEGHAGCEDHKEFLPIAAAQPTAHGVRVAEQLERHAGQHHSSRREFERHVRPDDHCVVERAEVELDDDSLRAPVNPIVPVQFAEHRS
eukprot:3786248-Prymnesium_polylepis.1